MDKLDSAVAAVTEAEANPTIEMSVLRGAFGDSGRPFEIAVPATITEGEAYALVELITKIRQQAFANESRSSKIVGLNGRTIEDASQFRRMIADSKVGSTAALRLVKNGRSVEIRVPIESSSSTASRRRR